MAEGEEPKQIKDFIVLCEGWRTADDVKSSPPTFTELGHRGVHVTARCALDAVPEFIRRNPELAKTKIHDYLLFKWWVYPVPDTADTVLQFQADVKCSQLLNDDTRYPIVLEGPIDQS